MSDCCAGLATIEKECGGGNRPGLKNFFYIACIDEVVTIPAPDANTHLVSTDIAMRAADAGPPAITAGTFKKFAISKINSNLTVEPVGEGENISYKCTMSCFINKITSGKTYILNNTTGGEFIIIAKDANGEQLIIGELENGATVKAGMQTNDANGYPVTIEWDTPIHPYHYTGNVTT